MKRGFTLLEVLVATLIMAIAVTGLLSSLSTSLRNDAKLTEYDRAALIAQARMDALLLDQKLPHNTPITGQIDPASTGWQQAGWQATVTPYDVPPGAAPGWWVLQRIELVLWWDDGGQRRTFKLEAFRRGLLLPSDPTRAVTP
jgi:general secretion pathway protein I